MLALKLIEEGDSVMWDGGYYVFDILDMTLECNDSKFLASECTQYKIRGLC